MVGGLKLRFGQLFEVASRVGARVKWDFDWRAHVTPFFRPLTPENGKAPSAQ